MELSVFGVGFTNRQSACFFICGGQQPLYTAGCSGFGFNGHKNSPTRALCIRCILLSRKIMLWRSSFSKHINGYPCTRFAAAAFAYKSRAKCLPHALVSTPHVYVPGIFDNAYCSNCCS